VPPASRSALEAGIEHPAPDHILNLAGLTPITHYKELSKVLVSYDRLSGAPGGRVTIALEFARELAA